MSSSKELLITKQYTHTVTNIPQIINLQEIMQKYNLQKDDNLTPYSKEFKYANLGDIICHMIGEVTCEPETLILYGEIVKDIQTATKNKNNNIELTLDEANKFISVFKTSKLKDPKNNVLSLFIMKELNQFILDFSNPKKTELVQEIKNS